MKHNLFYSIIICLTLTFALCSCKSNTDNTRKESESTAATAVQEQVPNRSSETATSSVTEQSSNNSTAITTEEAEPTVTQVQPPKEKHLLTVSYNSKILSKAIDGSNPEKQLTIYLPPSYYSSEKRYPTVYFFHGFGESPNYIYNQWDNLTLCMQQEPDKEFIAIEVDGRTLGGNGSFYVNSPVTGNWQDYVLKEIVAYMDENYRTISSSDSRGTAGFSMGGFAAINLAFLYPDTFSSVQAVCPGLLKDDELDLAMQTWASDGSFKLSYGRAFAPNVDSKSLCDIPIMDGSKEDTAICEKWLSGFGHLTEKIETYLALDKPLNKLQIIYGSSDYYSWIPNGCIYFSKLLNDNGIEHTLTELTAGHGIPSDYMTVYLFPFFSEALDFDE